MTRDEAIEKVQKLLALAESKANLNEAALAAKLAQSLMERFQIEEIAMAEDGGTAVPFEDVEEHEVDANGRMENWKLVLLGTLAEINTCRLLRRKVKYGPTYLMVVGRRSYAQTVRYMYGALKHTVEELAAQQARGFGRAYAASFKLGATYAIAESLRRARAESVVGMRTEAANQSQQALVRVDRALAVQDEHRAQLDDYLHGQKYGKLKNKITAGSRAGYHAGHQAGRDVDVNGARAARLGAGAPKLQ